jgi:hypothetical protein
MSISIGSHILTRERIAGLRDMLLEVCHRTYNVLWWGLFLGTITTAFLMPALIFGMDR